MVIKYIHSVGGDASDPLVLEVYDQIKRDFGKIVEPFSVHSSFPKLLAGVWMASREVELVGIVPRNYKEAVAMAVSALNSCPYCIDAHSIMLYASGEKGVADAICKGKYEQNSDVKIKKLVMWTLSTLSPGPRINDKLPFSKEFEPEIMGTVVFYHYINRIVNVFLGKTPLPSNHSWLKGILKIVSGRLFSRAVNRPKSPGDSLKFLPKADLPRDFSWSKGKPNVSEAFARFASVFEEIGNVTIDPKIRICVEEYIDCWKGKTPGISKNWVKAPIKKITGPNRIAAQLALLTAITPYQVDEKLVSDFKNYFPDDIKLLSLVSWANFLAAKKIGTWLYTVKEKSSLRF